MKRIILSGIQPTGVPHLGNYVGAIRNWVNLQNENNVACGTEKNESASAGKEIENRERKRQEPHEILLSVVDLHAITLPQQPKLLNRNILEMGMALLACGIDPSKSILFRQSKIQQHTQLAWILFCKTPVSWLSRMHQWKTKSDNVENEEESLSHIGLLSYPVLQAADILLYNTTHVPVGEDQSQHINLTTTIAKSFNSHYKQKIFTIPAGLYASDTSKRIMSLKNPLKKMSKSDLVDQSRINLTDSPDQIKSKIKKATTDSISGISYNLSSRPGITNLLHILMSIQDTARSMDHQQDQNLWSNLPPPELSQKVLEEFGHLNNSAFKELVADTLIDHLDPIRKKFLQHQKDPSLVLKAFEAGEEKAANIAQMTLDKVYASVGL